MSRMSTVGRMPRANSDLSRGKKPRAVPWYGRVVCFVFLL